MLKTTPLIFFFCFIVLSDFQPTFSKEWERVYLATYPRSGNHWTRYLVEEATHIATSSVYIDPPENEIEPRHLSQRFPWGGYCCDHGYEGLCRYPTKKNFVLIKTHYPSQDNISPFDRKAYSLAIRVNRNPIDSFYSRYVKQSGGRPKAKVPTEFVKKCIKAWIKFQLYWNKKPNVITFRYEDMLANPAIELRKILELLKYEFTEEDIARAVAKYPPQGNELKHLDKFNQEDLILIHNELTNSSTDFDYKLPVEMNL